MNFSDIKQFKVDKGIAVPVNPYTMFINLGFAAPPRNPNHIKFEQQINEFTFACSPELSGVYRVEMFGDQVWQYRLLPETEWTSDLNKEAYDRGFQVWYEEMQSIAEFETRIYLQLK